MTKTNFSLFNNLTMQSAAMAIVFTFGAGGAYYSLAKDVEANSKDLQAAKEARGKITADIVSTKTDIASIKTSQKHQQDSTKRILDLLEKRYTTNDR